MYVQVILSADMSITGAPDGSHLVNADGDNPLNTVAGIANDVQNNDFRLVLMTGDLAYADGYLCKYNFHLYLAQCIGS